MYLHINSPVMIVAEVSFSLYTSYSFKMGCRIEFHQIIMNLIVSLLTHNGVTNRLSLCKVISIYRINILYTCNPNVFSHSVTFEDQDYS